MSNLLKAPTHSASEATTVIPVCEPVIRQTSSVEEFEQTAESMQRLRDQTLLELQQLKERVEAECNDMLSKAVEQVEDIKRQAFKEGHESGYADGLKQVQIDTAAQCASRIEDAENVLQRATMERRTLLLGTHKVLAEVAAEATQRVLRRELTVASADIERLVSELLIYVAESNRVEIRVNPDDYETATAAHPAWKHSRFGEWDIVVIPDYKISRGGCELRSDHGRVDSTLETKLELLQSAISEVMERSVTQYVSNLD